MFRLIPVPFNDRSSLKRVSLHRHRTPKGVAAVYSDRPTINITPLTGALTHWSRSDIKSLGSEFSCQSCESCRPLSHNSELAFKCNPNLPKQAVVK